MKNFVLTAMVVLALAVGAQAGMILGTSAAEDNSVVHSTTADTDLLLVGYGLFGNSGISGVTFGTTDMTAVPGSDAVDSRLETQFFYTLNPGEATDVTITGSASGDFNSAIVAYNIKGVTDIGQVSAITSTQG